MPAEQPLLACSWQRDAAEPIINGAPHFVSIGGKGGGGRKDFAQAGGQDEAKIDQAFETIKKLI